MNKAVFFDRDGTINVDKHYVYKIEDFEFYPEVIDVLKDLREKGYILILITNQSGVARGYYTIAQLEELHAYMQMQLKKYHAQFDEILYCPHYENGVVTKYAIPCKCRKPESKLFEKAIEKYQINPKLSFAIGDKDRDLIPAKKLGIKCIKITEETNENWITCSDLEEVKRCIEKME